MLAVAIKLSLPLQKLFQHPLTNIEIEYLAHELGIFNFRGCFMKDSLPRQIHSSESRVVNLQNSDSTGSHWVAYFNDPAFDKVEYFDSFGVIPPGEIEFYLRSSKKPLVYNSTQHQNLRSVLCGWFCMLFINERWKGAKPYELATRRIDEKAVKSYRPFRTALGCQ